MYVEKNQSDNFKDLLKNSNFIQIIEPNLVKKYTKDKNNKLNISLSNLQSSLSEPNFLEGVFSYNWYDNVLKQNSYLVSIGLKSPIAVTKASFINKNILNSGNILPLTLSTDGIFYNKVDLYGGYLHKSKSFITNLLVDFSNLHTELVKEKWDGDLKNLQFTKLKFNVSHLNHVHAGLTVGLGGLKLFLPKGHRWMVYFPPNGHLRRLCVGNMNLSLSLLLFCVDFQKQLKVAQINGDVLGIIKNKTLLLEKLSWYQQIYNNYFNQFENELIKSTLLRQFKLKYLQLNNFYSLVINSSLKFFSNTLKKGNLEKLDINYRSYFDVILFLAHFLYIAKDLSAIHSKNEGFKGNNKTLSFGQKSSEIDSYVLQFLPFEDLKNIFEFKGKTKLDFILALVQENVMLHIIKDINKELNGLELDKKLYLIKFENKFEKELLNNFLNWAKNTKDHVYIDLDSSKKITLPVDIFIQLLQDYHVKYIVHGEEKPFTDINDQKNVEYKFIYDFYSNSDVVEKYLQKAFDKEYVSTEDLSIVNTNNDLISYVVSRKVSGNSFNLKLEKDNTDLHLM